MGDPVLQLRHILDSGRAPLTAEQISTLKTNCYPMTIMLGVMLLDLWSWACEVGQDRISTIRFELQCSTSPSLTSRSAVRCRRLKASSMAPAFEPDSVY